MECAEKIIISVSYFALFTVHHHQNSNELRTFVFFVEWSRLFDRLAFLPNNLMIIENPNFHLHVGNPEDGDAKTFPSSPEAHGLFKNFRGSTHIRGHTLNALITRESGSL